MDAFHRSLESAGCFSTPDQASVISKAYLKAVSGGDSSVGAFEQLRRNIDELPLIWLANSEKADEAVARRVLLGVTELAQCCLLEERLQLLARLQAGSAGTADAGAATTGLSKDEQDEMAAIDAAEQGYRDAVEQFARQVRHIQSQLLLRSSTAAIASAPTTAAAASSIQLLCAQPAEPLVEAESSLDAALVRLSDRLFGGPAAFSIVDDSTSSDSTADAAELRRVRELHRQVLIERGRIAGDIAGSAERSRRLRAHLDDPERTLSMAKAWLAEAKAASGTSAPTSTAEATTMESAAAAASSILGGPQERRCLDRRLARLRRLSEHQARLLDLLQRRRALHERLLTCQEAELARLRRLRALFETARRRLGESAADDAGGPDAFVVVGGDLPDGNEPDVNSSGRRMSAFLDRLTRLRARLPDNDAVELAAAQHEASSAKVILVLAEGILFSAGRLLAESAGGQPTPPGSASSRRLADATARLSKLKERWAAARARFQDHRR